MEELICRAGVPRRRYRRQEAEWDLVETVLGLRLPVDFKALSDRCRELWVGRLEVHIPRFEEVSFPAGSPARLNLRTRLEEEIAGAVDMHIPVEGEVLSEVRVRSCLERVGREVLEDADTGERCVFTMAPGRAELVPWGSHESGAVGYWHAVGEPDHWPVVVSYDGFLWWEGNSLVDYLLRALEGATRLPWLVEDRGPAPADS
ncbi:hypothetical protein HNR06_001008 [Nocardiopsis arvandica]|uniref:Knr4/Smi1-like domain-containing protein n=1 Tax=Nocardiopsis sinuspersici TaxID=501010 RepID=A0A7Y9X9F1_9ACTN|nr:hypothetical protein [Nocardiopsis sinuspersici]NYH51419.1 hypothetical protein [Nocardiopsis sinuspersici]